MANQWQNARKLKERMVVKGMLVLETPAHLGSGDEGGLVDMALLRDGLENKTLLPGASLAGALRHYLAQVNKSLAERLFGNINQEQTNESYLIFDDAIGEEPRMEIRDGVAISPKTRAAADKAKYNFELLEAGSTFKLNVELLVPVTNGDHLVEGLATCLKALEEGQIGMGKRKRRGFGRCKVSQWQVDRYPVNTPRGLFAWLDSLPSQHKEGRQIDQLLLGRSVTLTNPGWAEMEADFLLESSILIRSGSGEAGSPDAVHLHSKRRGMDVPIVSGTSLAGALRARALTIANTLGKDGKAVTDDLFGKRVYNTQEDHKESLSASRIWVDEAEIVQPVELVQSRLKIDRFTGGAYPGALFSEQPVFTNGQTGFKMRLRIQDVKSGDIGLLLLLLKDLWTGELPVGGESSVGRGRLKGQHARLSYQGETWEIDQKDPDNLEFLDEQTPGRLQKFVDEYLGATYDTD